MDSHKLHVKCYVNSVQELLTEAAGRGSTTSLGWDNMSCVPVYIYVVPAASDQYVVRADNVMTDWLFFSLREILVKH